MTEKSQKVYDLVNEMNWVQLYREMNFFHDSITDSIWMVDYNFFFWKWRVEQFFNHIDVHWHSFKLTALLVTRN